MKDQFNNLFVSEHPLVKDRLSRMRDENCSMEDFKSLLRQVALLVGYEATSDLPLTKRTVRTPITSMEAPVLADKEPLIVPILRAGLGMSEPLEELLPSASVAHVGMARNEETKEPELYLDKLPADLSDRSVLLVDPMIATGGSAKHTLDLIVSRGANPADIGFIALVAAPEGVQALVDSYPDVKIYVAELDERLNDKAYIVPGLGDAGDRIFGTIEP